MKVSPLLVVHLGAAAVALFSGFAALILRKGSHRHRKSGHLFFVSMLIMAGSALLLAWLKASAVDALVATSTVYLVATGWLTIERTPGELGIAEYVLALLALGICCFAFELGWRSAHSAGGELQGMPAVAYCAFGSVALGVFGLDAAMLVRGGIRGRHRLARHLWRLSIALLFITTSFFLPTRFELPSLLIDTHLNLVPVLFVAVALLYWLYRVLIARGIMPAAASLRESRNSPGIRTAHAPPTP